MTGYTPSGNIGNDTSEMKKTAEDYLGQEGLKRYNGPAYFSDSQRQATKEAVK